MDVSETQIGMKYTLNNGISSNILDHTVLQIENFLYSSCANGSNNLIRMTIHTRPKVAPAKLC